MESGAAASPRENGGVGPLSGIRVVDISRLLPGPYCTWLLSALGAEVIRVEPPGTGDPSRTLPPIVSGHGVFHAALDRGKRSVALDIRREPGTAAFRALVGSADVLVESFRPGRLAAAGLDPEELTQERPELIVCSITGYGQNGPLADVPGHDLNYQGYAGIVAACGGDRPRPYPVQVADVAGGSLMAVVSILGALLERERTGHGRWLDVSMSEGAMAVFAPHLAIAIAQEGGLTPGGELLSGGFAGYHTYRCADGLLLTVGALEPKFWARLAELVPEAPALPEEAALVELFGSRNRDAWVELLSDCCVGPALNPEEVPTLEHFRTRGVFESVLGIPMPRAPFPWSQDCTVASLGRDTEPVLSALAIDVENLVAAGVAQCGE